MATTQTRFHRRRHLADLLQAEAERCGLDALTVTSQSRQGDWQKWTESRGDPNYVYRTVLPSEIVFDVGDRGNWERCRMTTHRLWTLLNRWDVAYWGALTGGKGTHTHLFIRPSPTVRWSEKWDAWVLDGHDVRENVVRAVVRNLAEMEPLTDILNADDVMELLDIDPVCGSPNPQARQLREFGAFKPGADRKTLWTTGPGPFRFLPDERDEAYKYKDVIIPDGLPATDRPPGAKHREIADALRKPCPQGPFCFPGPDRTGSWGSFPCAYCPANF